MADEEQGVIMRLTVDPKTRDTLRMLARGNKSMGKFLDELAPALLEERHYIEGGGGNRSAVTDVLRREWYERQRREQGETSEG